jgi:hypothetical protein
MRRAWFAIILAVIACPARAGTPIGWFFDGRDRSAFTVDLDAEVKHGGSASGRLSSAQREARYGVLLQTIHAERFRGQRVRFSAWVRARDVSDWAGLFMRVEGAGGSTLAVDNMQARPIRGSKEWLRYEVVLDVGPEARRLHFGIGLSGGGAVWIDDAKVEPVGEDVASTALELAPVGPRNLDFEESSTDMRSRRNR